MKFTAKETWIILSALTGFKDSCCKGDTLCSICQEAKELINKIKNDLKKEIK